MASLLRALSAAMRLWRAAVKPASSVGVVGVLLHPAKPKAIVRAVVTRIVREAERLLRAYICPLLCGKHLHSKTTVNQGTAIQCNALARSFSRSQAGYPGLSCR